MFIGLLHNLIKRIIFAYQFKNRQNMEILKPTYKETMVNKVNQDTYFATYGHCSSMGKRPL